MPKVSVIIPVYNVEKYLGECLDSVLGQTLKDIEVICVDDGSTDGSTEILAEYAAKDARVKMIRQVNAGPGAARNRALETATGECIAFMDPDDRYPDDGVLQALSGALASSGCAVAGGRARCFPEDFPDVALRNVRSDRICEFPHFGVVDFADYQVPFRYWCYLYRREILESVRFPRLRSFEDVPFFASAMVRAGRFAALDRLVYAYRQHGGNATRRMPPVVLRDRIAGIGMTMAIAARNGLWRMFDAESRRARKTARKCGIGKLRLALMLGAGVSSVAAFRLLRGRVASAAGRFRNGVWRRILMSGPGRRWTAALCSRRGIDPRKVVFAPFSGTCCCNPKYIARALAKLRPDLDIVWLLDPAECSRLGGRVETGRAVPKRTLRALLETASAKVLVDNAQSLLSVGMPAKKPGQTWINTWHGSLGIKRLDTASERIKERALKMEQYDAVLVDSDFEEGVFRGSFFPRNRLLRYGHPRNDVFFLPQGEREALRARVKRLVGVAPDVRIALYAPTFREPGFAPVDFNSLSPGRWTEALAERFGGRWIVALRLHPHDAKLAGGKLVAQTDCLVDVSGYGDVQELLVAAEAGITDYSSWIFDFALGGSPGFILAPDAEDYERRRGFCYPLAETPFPLAGGEDALCASIRSFDAGKYRADLAAFLKARGCMEDGRASERAAAFISDALADADGKGGR